LLSASLGEKRVDKAWNGLIGGNPFTIAATEDGKFDSSEFISFDVLEILDEVRGVVSRLT